MSDNAEVDIADLSEQLSTTRKARLAAQRQAADAATVTMALERTSRDRSALSSPDVDAERERVQHLYDELTGLYGSVDKYRDLLARLKRSGIHPDTSHLEELLAAEADHRASAVTVIGSSRG